MRWMIMTMALVALALVAGCESVEHLPPRTPGGSVPPYTPGGADGGAGDAGYGDPLLVVGRVCRIVDLRYPTYCQQYPDMSGIRVAEPSTGAYTMTTTSGDFTLDLTELAGTSSVAVEVGYGDIDFISSVIWLDLSSGGSVSAQVPIVDAQAWNDLLTALAVVVPAGTGTIAVYLRRNNMPVIGGQVVSPSPVYGIYTDNGGVYDWLPDGYTGGAGTALLFGVRPPSGDFAAIDESAIVTREIVGAPVREDAITFLSVDLSY
jgi:hypothetical protein